MTSAIEDSSIFYGRLLSDDWAPPVLVFSLLIACGDSRNVLPECFSCIIRIVRGAAIEYNHIDPQLTPDPRLAGPWWHIFWESESAFPFLSFSRSRRWRIGSWFLLCPRLLIRT